MPSLFCHQFIDKVTDFSQYCFSGSSKLIIKSEMLEDLELGMFWEQLVKITHEYIAFLPVQETCFANCNTKKFLKAELTVKIMYSLLCQNYQDTDVSYRFYLKYFKENFGHVFRDLEKMYVKIWA